MLRNVGYDRDRKTGRNLSSACYLDKQCRKRIAHSEDDFCGPKYLLRKAKKQTSALSLATVLNLRETGGQWLWDVPGLKSEGQQSNVRMKPS